VVKNPIYSTGVGLLIFGKRQLHDATVNTGFDGSVRGVWERMKNWFQGNF